MIRKIDYFYYKIKEYCEVFPSRWRGEKFKWEAVQIFQENFDINAENLAENLKKSISSRFLNGVIAPKTMLINLAKYNSLKIKSILTNLFNETRELNERIEEFRNDCLSLTLECNNDLGTKYKTSGQSIMSAISLLVLRYPGKYFEYRERIFQGINFYFGMNYDTNRANKNRVRDSEKAYEEIRKILIQNELFCSTVRKFLEDKKVYKDPNLCVATSDFCFWVTFYENQEIDDDNSVEININENDLNYWWVTTNPLEFSFSSLRVHESKDFAIYNDKGNRKSVPKNFDNCKRGDKVVIYESDKTRSIIGLGVIEHENNGRTIGIKLIERLNAPITRNDLVDVEELEFSQPLTIKRGTLFALTATEFNIIYDIIRESNPASLSSFSKPIYTKEDFLEEVFISEEKYKNIRSYLNNKLNIIFEGPPGVGKTFLAKRLAYSIIGRKDDSHIEFVQFHQNYSYEDFVLGYKPNGNGFQLEEGIFKKFCQKAIDNPGEKYFFIIDEINRGNLSKIFGELLMAIENTYRDTEILLSYGEKKLKIPSNLYIIGLMNTADRSLALIDHALRRRFGFITLEPAFNDDLFKEWERVVGNEKFNKLIECIKNLNDFIRKDDSLGEGFCIGHSYFSDIRNPSKYSSIDVLLNIIRFEIIPTIKEYWFDDKDSFERWESELFRAIK